MLDNFVTATYIVSGLLFILALQGGLGAEVAGRHLAHPLGQHQERSH